MIFYINHFSLIIFIIPFGKALDHSGLSVQVHSQMVLSYGHTERIWQSPFVIINSQTGNGAEVLMTSCPEEMVLRILGFWKGSSWVFNRWKVQLSFLLLRRAVKFFGSWSCYAAVCPAGLQGAVCSRQLHQLMQGTIIGCGLLNAI